MPHSAEERKSFLSEKKLQSSYRGYQPLIGAFGAKGSIKGVDHLTLKIPKGLDEKTVAAIVIGASLDPNKMAYALGEFEPGSDITPHNQSLIMDQVASGQVPPQTAQILSSGRRDAKAALEAYKAGDDSLVKKHLRTYADHAVKKISEFMPDSNDLSIAGQSITLINDVLNENKFGIKPSGLPIGKEKLKAYRKANDARVKANEQQQRLLNKFGKLSQAEKEKLAAEMLFNGFVSAIPGTEQKQINALSDKIINKALLPMDIKPEDQELYDQVRNVPEIRDIERTIKRTYNYATITNEEAILAQDNGVDQLKKLSIAKIKQSALFQSIVNAKNKDELTDALMDAEAKFTEGLGSVEGVSIPVVNEKLNARMKGHLETENKSYNSAIPAAAAQSEAFREENAKYSIDGLEPEDMKKAFEQAKKIDEILTAANLNKENAAYEEIMEAIKNAEEEAECLAKQESIGSVDAESLSSKFSKINRALCSYIANSAETTPEMRKAFQQVNLMAYAAADSINTNNITREKQAIRDNGSELFNSFSKTRKENFALFPGEAYADPWSRPTTGGFSTSRSAGQSLASLYLCSQGYSIEDIAAPDKLAAEKQAAFSHIMDVLKQPVDKATKDIGKIIYDGRKAEFAQLNEFTKKIDFTDPDIQSKKEMNTLCQIALIDFDITQEMGHCKQGVAEAAKNDTNGAINSYDAYCNAYPILPMSNYIAAEEQINKKVGVIMTETSPQRLKDSMAGIATNRAQQNYILDSYHNARQKNPDVPFTKLLPPDFAVESGAIGPTYTGIANMKNSPLDPLANDYKLTRKNIKMLLNGPLLNARAETDPVTGVLIKDAMGFPKITKLPVTSLPEIQVPEATADDEQPTEAAGAEEVIQKNKTEGSSLSEQNGKEASGIESAPDDKQPMEAAGAEEVIQKNKTEGSSLSEQNGKEASGIESAPDDKQPMEAAGAEEVIQKNKTEGSSLSEQNGKEASGIESAPDNKQPMEAASAEEEIKKSKTEGSSLSEQNGKEASGTESALNDKLSMAAAEAKKARKKIFFGKKDFAEAVAAVEELNALRSGDAPESNKQISLDAQQKKAEEAKRKIDAYLNRKAKEEREGAHFNPRTQRCIEAMKTCLSAVNDVERSLREQQTAPEQQNAPEKQQKHPQAEAPKQGDNGLKDKAADAGKMQHNDKASAFEALLNSQLEEIRTVFKGKLGGEETCPAGEDKEVYLEGQKEQLAEFCSLTISANTIGGKLKKMAANPALKDADFKDALSVDSTKLGARVVEERPDFKQMIAKIKTWEDFSKLKNIAASGNGKQLIDELHKNSGEIERTQNRRFSRTKQLENNGKPVTKEQKKPQK